MVLLRSPSVGELTSDAIALKLVDFQKVGPSADLELLEAVERQAHAY